MPKFIPHPGYDVRCLVLGDRVLGTMRRFSNGDFRTNVALGGRFEAWDLPADWQHLAISAARAVGAPLAGVDLLPDKDGKPYVIEVNSTPGFQALSQVATTDIPAEIIRFWMAGDW